MFNKINEFLKQIDEMKKDGSEISFVRTPNGLRYRIQWKNGDNVFQYSGIISPKDLSQIDETNERLVINHILAVLTHELHTL